MKTNIANKYSLSKFLKRNLIIKILMFKIPWDNQNNFYSEILNCRNLRTLKKNSSSLIK